MLKEFDVYSNELSKINLSAKDPKISTCAITSLKNLHAKLKRFARQLVMVTTGYPVSPIDYMGDLSEGLNFLINQAVLRKKQDGYDRDHDTETGLLNRKAFTREVYDILQAQPSKVGVLFCCTLDNIKYINRNTE